MLCPAGGQAHRAQRAQHARVQGWLVVSRIQQSCVSGCLQSAGSVRVYLWVFICGWVYGWVGVGVCVCICVYICARNNTPSISYNHLPSTNPPTLNSSTRSKFNIIEYVRRN